MSMSTDDRPRCWPASDPLYVAYHDEEWGRPVTTEQGIYERLCLEGFQSGLSWVTILRKRENFRAAFAGFDPDAVARFGERDVKRLLGDAGIVRHRGKIEAAIANARGVLELREAGTPLHELVWSYAPESYGAPRTTADWHAQTRRVEGALEAAEGRGLPLRRADDAVGRRCRRAASSTTIWRRAGCETTCSARSTPHDPPERRSGLEQLLQPLEVLPELLLRTPRHDPRREAGQQARVADARDGEPRPVVVRLELVPHDERHGAVERAQREQRAARRTP